MLEQLNLEIRNKVWQLGKRPKRVTIFHSLISPESHATLEGLCYYSYLNNFEIWEYRYGEVTTFDLPIKSIKDRLNETSAVIFLLSKDYNRKLPDGTPRPIIKFELEEVVIMANRNDGDSVRDPLQVFGVDIGNQDLIDELGQKIKNFKIIRDISEIFERKNSENIKDIYECRRFRIRLKDCL